MSGAHTDDAAFRYTEDGQAAYHHLGTKLRQPTTNAVQAVSSFQPWDLATAPRRIAIGSAAYDLDALIRRDGNPQSLADFLAALRRGATVDYFPSLSEPSLSFPCIGVDMPELAPDPDFWHARRYEVPIRLRRIDGGTWQALVESPLLYWKGGNSLPGQTFARSSTAYQLSEHGVLNEVAANVWRTSWLDLDGDQRLDTPAFLAEPSRTNLVTSDDLTLWTAIGTPVVTASIDDPAGGTAAYTVEDNSGAGLEYLQRTVAFTGDAVKSATWIVRENTMPATGNQRLVMWDNTAAATRMSVLISAWVGGEPTVSADTGTYLGKRYLGNGYWMIYGQTTSVTAANTNQVFVRPTDTAAATGSIDVYRVNAFDATLPPFSILDASDARTVETNYATYVHRQQRKTAYIKMLEWGTAFGGNTGVYMTGSGNAARFQVYSQTASDGRYTLLYHNGTASVTAQIGGGDAVSFGDVVELLCVLDYNEDGDGDISISQSANGGATTTPVTASGPTGGLVTGAEWNQERVYIGSVGSGFEGLNPLIEIKEAAGVKTWAYMRAL